MQCKDKIHGFSVTRITEIDELDGVLYELVHDKTKAKLAWLDRDDENKTFMIAFKTIPENNTGVFHILEHSVLEGSKRYPAKATFVELMKTSVNTFLNAMTYPDKTVYPASSRNEKDFENLVRVYMDATLNPLIYERPETFYQEGWHYEFAMDGDRILRNGVVLNEMKGAYSSVDIQMNSSMNQLLFPDNCYRYVSGGDPEAIPTLSYEEFIETHKCFYHPTNARIFLDGKISFEHILQLLDEEYLSDFEEGTEIDPIPLQGEKEYQEHSARYEIAQKEGIEGKTQVALGYMAGTYDEKAKMFAIQILSDYLAGSNDAPLKAAILNAGLGEDMNVRLNEGIQQPYVTITVRNTDIDKKDAIKEIIEKTLAEVVKKGIDKEHIDALLNNMEFRCREQEYGRMPRGVIYGISALGSWLYDGDPSKQLLDKEALYFLREQLHQGYYETLIQEIFLNSKNHAMVCMIPDSSLGMEKEKIELQELAKIKDGWDEEELNYRKEIDEHLQEWQSMPDSLEALNSIPVLHLSDMEAPPENIPIEVKEDNGLCFLHHPISTRGIEYMKLYFSMTDITLEELPIAVFLSSLLGELGTEKSSAVELKKHLKSDLGYFEVGVEAMAVLGNATECKTFLRISVGALEEKAELISEYLKEVLLKTDYSNGKRIRELLTQQKEELMQSILASGHQYGVTRVKAMSSASGVASETMRGYTYYRWLKEKQEELKTGKEILCEQLSALAKRIFTLSGLIISTTGTKLPEVIKKVKASFPEGSIKPETVCYTPLGAKTEGICIPSNVAYAVTGTNLNRIGMHRTGDTQVLQNLLSLNYLWNMIRVQGGAYGTGLQITREDDAFFYSYRDPNPANSLMTYQNTPIAMEQMLSSIQELDGIILGSLSQNHPLLTPQMAGTTSDHRYLSGISYEKLSIEWKEMLETTSEKLLELTDMIKAVLKESGVCVVGGREQLEACGISEIYEI